MKRFRRLEYFFYLSLFITGCAIYFINFTIHLQAGQADLSNYKGVILSDSLMYDGTSWVAIKTEDLNFESAFKWIKEYPTLLPMTLLAYVLGQLQVEALFFNVFLAVVSSFLLLRIGKKLNLFPRYALAAMFLNTAFIFYSQSFSKEIILSFASCLLAYGYLNRSHALLLLAVFITMVIRIPLALPMVGVLGWITLKPFLPQAKRNKIGTTIFLIFAVATPLLYSFSGLMKATEDMLRNIGSTSGVSFYYLKTLRIPFLPLLFLPIRILQNLFEPLLALRSQTFIPPLNLNSLMLVGAGLINLILISRCLLIGKGLKDCLRSLCGSSSRRNDNLNFLLLFSSVVIVMFAFLPFIQIRYFVPLAPLLGLIVDLILKGNYLVAHSEPKCVPGPE